MYFLLFRGLVVQHSRVLLSGNVDADRTGRLYTDISAAAGATVRLQFCGVRNIRFDLADFWTDLFHHVDHVHCKRHAEQTDASFA